MEAIVAFKPRVLLRFVWKIKYIEIKSQLLDMAKIEVIIFKHCN